MKRYLILALAALGLALAAPSAFATHVIFDPPMDPPPPPVVCTAFETNCNIYELGQAYQMDFMPCSQPPMPGQAAGSSAYNWCLWFNNVSGHGGTKFTFSFVPNGGSLVDPDQVDCSSSPSDLATSNCPSTLPTSGPLTVTFFTHSPLQNNFYIYTDFAKQPGPATVTVSVPEPGALGMFGLGLLVLGVGFGWQKRRQVQTSRS